MTRPVKSVLVAGYGTMGRGIALTFAEGGFETIVLSRNPDKITDLPHGVVAKRELPEAAPDLIIESIPEEMALKHELFLRLEAAYGAGPILATNTSGLPIDEIAAPLEHRERFLAIHYMQPAEAFPMVEVCRLEETDEETLDRAIAALKGSGKDSVVLRRPIIGFLINRLQHAILHEAYCLIEDGITSVEDVDAVARRLFGPRMCVTGLIEQKDLGGLDVNATAQRSIVPALYHTGVPCQMLQDMVAKGDFGVKTGRGFYDWSDRDIDARRREVAEKLDRLKAALDD